MASIDDRKAAAAARADVVIIVIIVIVVAFGCFALRRSMCDRLAAETLIPQVVDVVFAIRLNYRPLTESRSCRLVGGRGTLDDG